MRRVAGNDSRLLDLAMPRLSRLADHGLLWTGLAIGLWVTGDKRARRAAWRGIGGLAAASAAAKWRPRAWRAVTGLTSMFLPAGSSRGLPGPPPSHPVTRRPRHSWEPKPRSKIITWIRPASIMRISFDGHHRRGRVERDTPVERVAAMVQCSCGHASTWTVTRSAPARRGWKGRSRHARRQRYRAQRQRGRRRLPRPRPVLGSGGAACHEFGQQSQNSPSSMTRARSSSLPGLGMSASPTSRTPRQPNSCPLKRK